MGWRWSDQPWAQDPQHLVSLLEKVYGAAVRAGKIRSVATVTVKKMMAFRNWTPKIPLSNLLEVVDDLGVAYVPNDVPPGPAFLFPIPDVTLETKRLQIRLCDEAQFDLRYVTVGDKNKFIGPMWFGADDENLQRIIRSSAVLVVEGPFDLLAVRTMVPEFPALCPMGKRLTEGHLDYLQLCGVEKIITLWDADDAGRAASSRDVKRFRTLSLDLRSRMTCKDPADALRNYESAFALRDLLLEAVPRQKVECGDD